MRVCVSIGARSGFCAPVGGKQPSRRGELGGPASRGSRSRRRDQAVAITWANQDLPGAVEWGRQLPDESERQSALVCIGFEAARADPLAALALAVELNADP